MWRCSHYGIARQGISLRKNIKLCTSLIALILSLQTSLAVDLPSAAQQPRLRDPAVDHESLLDRYLPDFLGFDRSLIGRAADEIQTLSNNAPKQSDIDGGDVQFWIFKPSAQRAATTKPKGLPSAFDDCPSNGSLSDPSRLQKEANGPNLFISLNTCDQPSTKKQSPNSAPNQLELYVSTSSSNQKPDARKHDYAIPVDGGYGSINLTFTGDVFVGIAAPTSDEFEGSYNYEIAASVDDYYAKSIASNASYFVDSDNRTALIDTANTTSCTNTSSEVFKAWKVLPPPFSIFVSKQDDASILGLEHSMCGLKRHAQVQKTTDVERIMTFSGGGQPKQQFYVKSLNASSAYYAIVGIEGSDGNSSSIGGGKINGGGTIWAVTNFTTKSSECFPASESCLNTHTSSFRPKLRCHFQSGILFRSRVRSACQQDI